MTMSGMTPTCSRCSALEADVHALKAEVARLAEELAKTRKNSANSSKRPSSDIVKPPRDTDKAGKKLTQKRKRGGQPGHQRHQRPPFEASQIDKVKNHSLSACPHCGGPVELSEEPPRVKQQVEIESAPITITEHRGQAYWCPHCQKTHYAAIPEPVREAGLFGPRLYTLVAYLKGACHCSFSTIRKFLRDVVGVKVSRGYLAQICATVSESILDSYEFLLNALPKQLVVNVDETGHQENGERLWTWCFRAPLFTLFKISRSRGSEVLIEVLGKEFDGLLGCDYFSAYRKYMGDCGVLVQFCLAHLIRDIKFLTTHPDPRNKSYGNRVLDAVRALFAIIHRRDTMSANQFASKLQDAGNTLWGEAIYRVPSTKEAQNLANRFEKHGDSYIRFITTPGIEPTNNLAEQAIRFVVIDRHITQGTRSETGRHWSERIWTVIATCTQQGRSVFSFLYDSIVAYFQDKTPPELLPNTS
jgi:transposase